MPLIRPAFKYLQYRLKSFRLHGVHSPFIFNLYHHVICHDGNYYTYLQNEELRESLLIKNQIIAVTDLGAGSKTNSSNNRRISDIAKISAKAPKYAQLLFRLVNFYQPKTILELGTSLGLTTAYLASANKNGQVITLEGCPNTAKTAQANFQKLQLKNIRQVTGNMDQTLAQVITDIPAADFVFFDGNHRYEPTMRYFNTCLTKYTEDSIFILDDIYWSAEMEKAWREICRHPAVTLSVDLFQIGLVFFRKKQPKQHFTLWY